MPASIVVFLVALPLCLGIAIASGVPPAQKVTIRMRKLWHVDHTCAEYLTSWIKRRQALGETVRLDTGTARRHRGMALGEA